jgi:hypothetical protein
MEIFVPVVIFGTSAAGASSAFQRLTLFLSLGAVVWLAIVVALGDFLYEHVTLWRLTEVGSSCACRESEQRIEN